MCNPLTKVKDMRHSCEHYIDGALEIRLEELDKLMRGAASEMLGRLEDYALCFDYVAPGTFQGQDEAYLLYQMSWGGPSDEFRFFVNPDLSCHRIEYWFMNWFDGAHRICTTNETVLRLWQWLSDIDAVAAAVPMVRH
jgi:hypothetical protein